MIFRKYCKFLLLVVLLAVVMEATVLNYKYYVTSGNTSVDVENYIVGEGLTSTGEPGVYKVTSSKDKYIEINNINQHIQSLKADISYSASEKEGTSMVNQGQKQKINVEIYGTDAANELYFSLGDRNIVDNVTRSQYMLLHLSGESSKLKLVISADMPSEININDIVINPVIPFSFSIERVIAMILIAMTIYIIRPKSELYSIRYDSRNIVKICADIFIITAVSLAIVILSKANPIFTESPFEHHYQYQELAESFAEGHAYLDIIPEPELSYMDNPYDNNLRSENGVRYLWDRAYYNGKYYVYFGVVPVLTYYLPVYLVTGQAADTYTGMAITGILLFIGMMALINGIIKRWFKNIPYILYLYMVIMFATGSGLLSMMIRPDFYTFPITMGIMFSVWGLYFWITAAKSTIPEHMEDGKTECMTYSEAVVCLSKRKLIMGSLCMALVAGCRPQLLLMSFIAIPLFWNEVFKQRILMSVRKWANTFSFIAPYVIIATGIMYYNYIRFGSVFDFGANYNLTTNDMTHRGFVLGRTGIGIFAYLFQLPNIESSFPFVQSERVGTTYLGNTISENMMGGLLACNILLILIFMTHKVRKYLCARQIYGITVLSIISGCIIIVVDTQMAGILPRYIYDFAWIMFLAVTFIVLMINERLSDTNNTALLHIWRSFLCLAFIWGMSYNFCRLFVDTAQQIEVYNPGFFYNAAYKVAFWM